MGSVVGEKIKKLAIDYARKTKTPLIIISKSGGARMMEFIIFINLPAKTSAKFFNLEKKVFHIFQY